jgi:hypothetical protein
MSQDAAVRANAAIARVASGDKRAQSELRKILDSEPDLWLSAGDIAYQAELSLINVMAGDNDVVKDAIGRKLKTLRAELRGADPTPLEKLLVDRVVAGWLALSYAEANYHQNLPKGLRWDDSEYMQRRLDRANRRYLSAIRTLVTVRRLLQPVMQVNIADQQINVAGTVNARATKSA